MTSSNASALMASAPAKRRPIAQPPPVSSAEISLGLRDQQRADQVDSEDDNDEHRQRHRDLRRACACERNEGRHHAAQRKADIPRQTGAAGADLGWKPFVEED